LAERQADATRAPAAETPWLCTVRQPAGTAGLVDQVCVLCFMSAD